MDNFSTRDGGTIAVPGVRAGLRERLLGLVEPVFASGLARHLLLISATGIVVFMYGYYFGTYDQAIHIWRVFSERSTVATLPELMDIAFAPAYLDTWRTRFEIVSPGALERLDGNALAREGILKQAFYSLSEDDVVRAGCRFNASYLVTDRPRPYALKRVYANETFAVYTIPLETCSLASYPR